MKHLYLLTLTILLTAPAAAQVSPPLVPEDVNWSDAFGSAGVSGTIHTVLTEGCEGLYVGGEFTAIGGVPARNVARWDGSTWQAVGTGVENGIDGPVYALAIFRDELYAGGRFDSAGNSAASNLARFDGNRWLPLGSGLRARDEFLLPIPAYVYALEPSREALFVGGRFDTVGSSVAHNVAAWSPSGWQALGAGLQGDDLGSPPDRGVVFALAQNQYGLYAGGRFSRSATPSLNGLARWDGSRWSSVASDLMARDGKVEIRALQLDGLDLYVGGRFDSIGSVGTSNLAVRHGLSGTWMALGAGSSSVVRSLQLDGDQLYASGRFLGTEGQVLEEIAVWRDGGWQALSSSSGPAADSTVFSIAVDAGNIYFGGAFSRAGSAVAAGIASYDVSTRTWQALNLPGGAAAGGINGPVYAVAVDSNYVYVGGAFTAAGLVPVRSLARWNRATGTWSAVGAELNVDERVQASVIPVVRALKIVDGDLYVGGRFDFAGGLRTNNIARWTGSSWQALGAGIGQNSENSPYDSTSTVFALAGREGSLFVGGEFIYAGGSRANRVARWDITSRSWESLGGGIGGSSFNTRVYALTADEENLYVAGVFPVAGTVRASNIAKWDGGFWEEVGNGANNAVFALALDSNGVLYAGGSFTTAGNQSASRIAQFDGSQWSPLERGLVGNVYALTGTTSGVIVGGEFAGAGAIPLGLVGRWDGGAWVQLGTALQSTIGEGVVRALDHDGNILLCGGRFTVAGGDPSLNVALWNFPSPPIPGRLSTTGSEHRIPSRFSID